MFEVEFHTGVADPTGFACRLLRKACRQGVRVQVTASSEQLSALDRALWTQDERDFIPHARMPGVTDAVAVRTPIWLSTQATPGTQAGAPRVLVNLGAAAPADMQALDRLVEIVGTEADDVAQGRQRWRAYKAAGLNIKHHAAT
jgi:DNA polymerase-3 subunit chi